MTSPAFQRLIEDGGLDVARLERRGIDVQAAYEALIEEVKVKVPPQLAHDLRHKTEPRHGTPYSYKTGCRCVPCTEAHRVSQRDQRTASQLRARALEANDL